MVFLFLIWCMAVADIYAADISSGSDKENIVVNFPHAEKVEVKRGRFPILDNLAKQSLIPGIVELNDDSGVNQEFLKQLNEWFVSDTNMQQTRPADVMQKTKLSSTMPDDIFNTLSNKEIFKIAGFVESWLTTVNTLEIAAEVSNEVRNAIWNAWVDVLLKGPIPQEAAQAEVTLKNYIEISLSQHIISTALSQKFDIKSTVELNLVSDVLERVQDSKEPPVLYKTCSNDNVALLCKKDKYTLVVIPKVSLKRYYAYTLPDKETNITLYDGDVSSDGILFVTFIQREDNKGIALYVCPKHNPNNTVNLISSTYFPIPSDVDMSMARIVFSADGDYFYGVYTTNTNEKVYVTRDKSRGMQINSNSSMLKEITDPWIKKILDNTNISNECRGSMQVKPFFNKKVLHRSFFNINEAAARESNFSFGQVSCAGTSCIHYELRKNDKNKNIIRRTDFDIDKRMDPLFVALNKKYELFKNTTGDAVTLYPIALAIAYILQSNWTITPQELERKMGVLYRYIDFDLRKLIVVQLKPSFANATRYWLYTKSNSFLASVRTMSLVDSIKYGLGTVWWGVKMGGYVFLLYNMVKFARSSISKLRSQPGI